MEPDAISPFESVLAIALLQAGQLKVVGEEGPLAIFLWLAALTWQVACARNGRQLLYSPQPVAPPFARNVVRFPASCDQI